MSAAPETDAKKSAECNKISKWKSDSGIDFILNNVYRILQFCSSVYFALVIFSNLLYRYIVDLKHVYL